MEVVSDDSETEDEESILRDVGEDEKDDAMNVMRRALEECAADSLRHRHISQMIQTKEEHEEEIRRGRELYHEQRKSSLMVKGISRELAELLPEDPSEPFPTPIRKEIDAINRAEDQATADARRKQAEQAFQNNWVKRTEEEIHQCSLTLASANMPMRVHLQDHVEVLSHKLLKHHENNGTTRCETAVEERTRACIRWGLLDQRLAHKVKTLHGVLPADTAELSSDNEQGAGGKRPAAHETEPFRASQKKSKRAKLSLITDHFISTNTS